MRKAPKHAKAQPKDCSSKKKELYFLENTKTWKSAFSKIIVPIKRTPYFLEGSETYRLFPVLVAASYPKQRCAHTNPFLQKLAKTFRL